MSGTDIFISYSSADRIIARRFAEAFEREGLSVWWDAALSSGQTFDEVIEAELRSTKAVVVLWSPRSVISRWVRAEATLADRHNKLVPAVIEACERPIIFELTHTAALSHWTGDPADPAWLGFLQDVRRVVARNMQASVASTSPLFGGHGAGSSAAQPARMLADGDQLVLTAPPRAVALESQVVAIGTGARPAKKFDPITDEFHCLEQVADHGVPSRYVVSPTGLRIGRTIPADIVIPDPNVSRVHCLIELADDRLQVSDLKSTNGTYIDGKRIHGRAFLDLGSIIQVGDTMFRHKLRRRAEALRA